MQIVKQTKKKKTKKKNKSEKNATLFYSLTGIIQPFPNIKHAKNGVGR